MNDKRSLALVTAGARRLGRAICLRLAEHGYDIALHYNSSKADAEETRKQVQQKGTKCELFACDLNESAGVVEMFASVCKQMGVPTLLVNNASFFERNKLRTSTENHFDVDFNVHVKAPFFLIREFANRAESGEIINISDTCVTKNGTDYFTYLLSKKTLHQLTQMAAFELAPNFRVNEIAPGIILPPVGIDPDEYKKFAASNPLKREAGPADILVALDYLLKNVQVTGQCLFVDGGDHVAC